MCSKAPLCIPDSMQLVEGLNQSGNDEDEYNNATRTFSKLIAAKTNQGFGDPGLIPVKRQLKFFKKELSQMNLLLKLARSGSHGVRDASLRVGVEEAILTLEDLNVIADDGWRQLQELSCLSYLSEKNLIELKKEVPNEPKSLQRMMDSTQRWSQMENRLDIAMKQLNVVTGQNSHQRMEIIRLLIERNNFNNVWHQLLSRLVKGKLFLLDVNDVMTTAGHAFSERQDCVSRLDALKWQANHELDRDITELQHRLDYLQQLEEFLRVKGTLRICEAVEIERRQCQEADLRISQQIMYIDHLLDTIQEYCGSMSLREISESFCHTECLNIGVFRMVCSVVSEFTVWDLGIEAARIEIDEQCARNAKRLAKEMTVIRNLQAELEHRKEMKKAIVAQNASAAREVVTALRVVSDIARIANIDYRGVASLLGSTKALHKFNLMIYLKQIERVVIQQRGVFFYYSKLKKSEKADRKKESKAARVAAPKPEPLKGDPPEPALVVEPLRPNRLDKLVTYQPCPYCVEDYIMNQVMDEQWAVFTDDDVMSLLQPGKVNTSVGIYTITDPSKRHPLKGPGGE